MVLISIQYLCHANVLLPLDCFWLVIHKQVEIRTPAIPEVFAENKNNSRFNL